MWKNTLLPLVLSMIIVSASAGVIKVEECGSVGELVHVIVPSCSTPPCLLEKGKSYSVEMDFEIRGINRTNLVTVVEGEIAGILLPWNGVRPEGCLDLSIGSCPLFEWDYITYAVTLYVEPWYPSVSLRIKWQIKDDLGRPQFCFFLPALIR